MGAKNAKCASKLDKKDVSKLHSLIKGELSEEEIQVCYKTYQEGRNSKKSDELNRDEFKKVYNALFHCESEEFADHVFRSFDVNNDGHVNFQEFLLGLCLSGSTDAETKITWAFKVYDIDGDGTISWAEMRNIIQSVSNITSDNVLDQIENNLHHHNEPSKENQSVQLLNNLRVRNIYETRDRVAELADRLFLELDSDKDGTITLEEFRDGALKLPIVITLLDSCMD